MVERTLQEVLREKMEVPEEEEDRKEVNPLDVLFAIVPDTLLKLSECPEARNQAGKTA